MLKRIVSYVFIGFFGYIALNTISATIYFNWYDPGMLRLQEKFSKEGAGFGGTRKECIDSDGRGCEGISTIIIGASNLVARNKYCEQKKLFRLGGWYDSESLFGSRIDTFSIYFKKMW
jgi:hypothetical protein